MMKNEHTLREKGKEKLKEWKQFAEDVNHQLHLGATETKEAFETQKKNLSKLLHTLSDKLEHAQEFSKESVQKVKSSLEELRVQAALGKADTEEKLKEQQKNLAHGVHDLRNKILGMYASTKEGTETFFEEVGEQLEGYHTRFDLFRLQIHLGGAEVKEEWEGRKHELTHKLAEIKAKLNGAEEDLEEKWKGFSTEMKSAWGHFRKAFKNP